MIADGGYKVEEQIYSRGHCREASRMEVAVRASHETINSCLKNCKVLSIIFRHDLCFHPRCLYAVVNLVQLALEHEAPLFQLE